MPARLAVYLPHQPVRQCDLTPEKTFLIGRGPDCDFRFDDPRLSRHHARIAFHAGGWILADLGSKNGTLLNGRAITEAGLASGSWLSLGGLVARFEDVSEARLNRERQRAARLRETTHQLKKGLDPALGVESLINRVLESVIELSGLERGFLLLAGSEGRMRLAAAHGLTGGDLGDESFTGSWGAVRRSLDEGKALVSGDVEALTGIGGRPSIVSGGIRALACVPLRVSDRVTGLVYADSPKPGRQFSDLDLELLEALCDQAAVAIGVARLGRELVEIREVLPAGTPPGPEVTEFIRDRTDEYRPLNSDTELANSVLAGGNS